MAIDMTEIYHRHHAEYQLSIEECSGLCHVAKMVRSVEASRALVAQRPPVIIISSAGGTRGGRIVAGERCIRIHGEDVAVDAEVVSLPGMSAHADAQQIVQWLATAPRPPRGIYLNHGEPGPADALRQRIERERGWSVTVPRHGQMIGIQP